MLVSSEKDWISEQHTAHYCTYMYSMKCYCNNNHGRLSWYNCCKKLCLFFYLCFIEDAGYEFNINGQIRKFRGTIAYISGDNLDLQQIGGFKEGSQAYRKCRACMATSDGLQSHVCTCIATNLQLI